MRRISGSNEAPRMFPDMVLRNVLPITTLVQIRIWILTQKKAEHLIA
jgi:hypothetical protein